MKKKSDEYTTMIDIIKKYVDEYDEKKITKSQLVYFLASEFEVAIKYVISKKMIEVMKDEVRKEIRKRAKEIKTIKRGRKK